MVEEIWRPIVGYEGLYEVSSMGRVRRVARKLVDNKGKIKGVSECLMKVSPSGELTLRKDDKYFTVQVRALVSEAFLGIKYGEPVSHIDRDTTNANLGNLMRTEDFRKLDPNWRDIPGWEGEYQASRFGEIRSVDRYIRSRNGKLRYCPGVIRTMDENEFGYYQIALYRNGKAVINTLAHIFIAKAWIPNPENKPTVNHIDGNKKNNNVENLEWATYEEQQAHVVRMGLRTKPFWSLEQNGPVGGDWNERRQVAVRCIETGIEYPSLTAAGEAIGQSASEVKRSVDAHKMCAGVHFVKASEPDYEFGVKSRPGEEWKDIPGYEGRYQISSQKRVKSVQRTVQTSEGHTRIAPEKLINLKYGLHLISADGKGKTLKLTDVFDQTFGSDWKQRKLFNMG